MRRSPPSSHTKVVEQTAQHQTNARRYQGHSGCTPRHVLFIFAELIHSLFNWCEKDSEDIRATRRKVGLSFWIDWLIVWLNGWYLRQQWVNQQLNNVVNMYNIVNMNVSVLRYLHIGWIVVLKLLVAVLNIIVATRLLLYLQTGRLRVKVRRLGKGNGSLPYPNTFALTQLRVKSHCTYKLVVPCIPG